MTCSETQYLQNRETKLRRQRCHGSGKLGWWILGCGGCHRPGLRHLLLCFYLYSSPPHTHGTKNRLPDKTNRNHAASHSEERGAAFQIMKRARMLVVLPELLIIFLVQFRCRCVTEPWSDRLLKSRWCCNVFNICTLRCDP